MHRWLILTSLLWTIAAGESAYRWVDENGVVHYSDRPMPGAIQVELAGSQRLSTQRPARATPSAPVPQAQDRPAQVYRAFNVLRPGQQETLWNIGATLDVEVELSPGLQPGHHLGVFLDGELIDLGAASLQFQVPEVFRGLHTLQAVILDGSGEEVLRSLAVTFMVQQTSILNPNNPNRPPPRPAG